MSGFPIIFGGKLLSVFAGAAVAYSTRIPAGSTYNGPLLRVRRSSDNAEQDIGATPVPITRQNYNPNPTFAGSTVGAAQPAGTVLAALVAGLTASVVATGNTLDGFPYVDWRVSGTPTSAGAVRLQFTNANTVGAPWLLGQKAVASIGLALSAGSFANISSLALRISERNSSGVLLGSSSLDLSAPTSAVQRVAYCAIAQDASCAIAHSELNFSTSFGLPVDVTLRLSVANIESQVTLNAAPLLTNVITTVAPIGFLDVNALDSFVPVPARSSATTSVFVPKWYEQSGNARDAAQTTAANQPRIVSAGVVDTLNGKPSVWFDGAQTFLSTLYVPPYSAFTFNAVCQTNSTDQSKVVIGDGGGSGITLNRQRLQNHQTCFGDVFLTDTPSSNAKVFSASVNGIGTTTQSLWKNGGTPLSGATTRAAAGPAVVIGAYALANSTWLGFISECTAFELSLSTATRQALERSQGTAFEITVA